MKSGDLTTREKAIRLHCASIEHESIVQKSITMKDDKLNKLATSARDLCSKVKQHYRIDKMSGYLGRLLKVSESIDEMIKEDTKSHCSRLTTVEEYSKLLLATDDLFIESGKLEVCQYPTAYVTTYATLSLFHDDVLTNHADQSR